MYKLPKDIKLDFFIGKTLFSIDISVHSLIFRFDDGLTVTVMSSIGYVDSTLSLIHI